MRLEKHAPKWLEVIVIMEKFALGDGPTEQVLNFTGFCFET